MPIRFACSCGKQLQAKDDFSGRKLKCPACGNILTIPNSSTVPEPTENKPSDATEPFLPPNTSAPTAETTDVSDPTQPFLPPNQFGPPAATEPGSVVPVAPIESEAKTNLPGGVQTMAPKKKPSGKTKKNPWKDGFLDQAIAPWPEEDRTRLGAFDELAPRNRGLGITFWVIVLLFVGAAIVSWNYWDEIQDRIAKVRQAVQGRDEGFQDKKDQNGEGGDQEIKGLNLNVDWANANALDLVPGDAQFVASVEVSNVFNSAIVKSILAEMNPLLNTQPNTQFMLDLIQQSDIRQSILVVPSIGNLNDLAMGVPQGWVVLVETEKSLRDDLLVKKKIADSPKQLTIEGLPKNLVFHLVPDKKEIAFALVNDKLLLFGQADKLEDYFWTLGGTGKSMEKVIETIRSGNHITMGGIKPAGAFDQKLAKRLLDLKTTSLTINFKEEAGSGKGIDLEVSLVYEDEKRAKAAKQEIPGIIFLANLGIGPLRQAGQKEVQKQREKRSHQMHLLSKMATSVMATHSPLGPVHGLAPSAKESDSPLGPVFARYSALFPKSKEQLNLELITQLSKAINDIQSEAMGNMVTVRMHIPQQAIDRGTEYIPLMIPAG